MRLLRAGMLIFMLPFCSQAADAAWSASGRGVTLSNRGVEASSASLTAAAPATGPAGVIYWRYILADPIPAGLQVKLCSSTRCTALDDGASGSTRGLTNIDAGETLRFIFSVPGGGRISPPLTVQSCQVTVNYRVH